MRRQYHIILTATWDSTTTNQSKHPPLGMLNSQQGILCCLRLTSSKILPHFILVSRGTVANKLYICIEHVLQQFRCSIKSFQNWRLVLLSATPFASRAGRNKKRYNTSSLCSFQTDRMFTDGAQGITRAT